MDEGSTIVEIGGGANPIFSEQQVLKGRFNYVVIDVDEAELNKAQGTYFQKLCMDITMQLPKMKAELILTNMVLEHVKNPDQFHLSCLKLLKDNGRILHFFATKYSLASIVNMLLPENWSEKLLKKVQSRNWENEGKFPAYYRRCLGPTSRQISYFQEIGFEVKHYCGYIGQNYFVGKPLFRIGEKLWNRILMTIRSPYLCSNAIVILKKQIQSFNHN